MNKTGKRLEKTNKDRALKILTSGVPSMSIHYENRRQVFVEGKIDATFYEKIYDKLRERLIPEISINFIYSGVTKKDGSSGVKKIVNTLSKFGTKTIYGIIDWDEKNEGNHFIKVLGKDKRYSIENYIFDPLLLGAFLVREKIIPREELGFYKNETYSDIRNFDSKRLQKISDSVLGKILPTQTGVDQTKELSTLINQKSIELPKHFLVYPGHKLAEKIMITFPPLNSYRKEDRLKTEIIEKIIDDIPEILSSDLERLLKEIQNIEV